MWFLLLFTLAGSLATNVEKRSIEIHEKGAVYQQTMTFDFERNVQIIHVPAHNDIAESTTIFDFNKGVFVESQPSDLRCYVKKIPSTMATMKQNLMGLNKRKELRMEILDASSAPLLAKYFVTTEELQREDLTVLEMREECRGHQVFKVEEIDVSLGIRSRTSFGPVPANQSLTGAPGQENCRFSDKCMWQTCYFGKDSCFWTVSCPNGDVNCGHMIHNGNFHVNGNPLTCKACFNTVCNNDDVNCYDEWHNKCDDGAKLEHAIPECSNEEDAGNDCGVLHCPVPSDEDTWKGGNGTFSCPQDKDHAAYVLDGHMCMFTCADGFPGGFITCLADSETEPHYEDNTICR